MQVAVLGNRGAVGRCARQLVALENRHPAEKSDSTRAAHKPAMLAPMTTAWSLVLTVLAMLPAFPQRTG
ncbi:hypothetical protein NIIDMKKI_58820 [Mycobacterium kansasii]|uniref:Uncharacterized protein n=1 Tax=Mycobacterium kansasii TaxID=1768 RepID=A0A7G1II23_MYCKA|nr:hypothetical protein NIIDMKKI_58820 [Mycobacterium kansasii]